MCTAVKEGRRFSQVVPHSPTTRALPLSLRAFCDPTTHRSVRGYRHSSKRLRLSVETSLIRSLMDADTGLYFCLILMAPTRPNIKHGRVRHGQLFKVPRGRPWLACLHVALVGAVRQVACPTSSHDARNTGKLASACGQHK